MAGTQGAVMLLDISHDLEEFPGGRGAGSRPEAG